MKAITQDVYGSADVLAFSDVDKPTVGEHDVLIRVHAAGVDMGVWHLMEGIPYPVRAGFGVRAPKNRVPGTDVAGIVEEVGVRVTRLRTGDEVFGTCKGSFAEYARGQEDGFVLKPANVTFEQAAAIPISALAALQAVRDKANVQPGQRVLAIGAAGGVGTYAVQLAKAFGAHVTGVCSTTKVDLVRSIGAEDVIDYEKDDFAARARDFDVILDIAGGRPVSQLRRALTPTGTLVIVGNEHGGRWFGGMDRMFGALLLSPFVKQRLVGLLSLPRKADLEYLAEIIGSRKVTPVVDRTYPLSEVPEAIRYVAAGRARGKVVITG
jgi:NADPH:quinone reductase-like Zn-dependent oxidoreductase